MVQSAQNPFSAPKAQPDDGMPMQEAGSQILAERGTRLGAAIIDGLIALLVMIPAMVAGFKSGILTSGKAGPLWFITSDPLGIVSTALWVGLMLFQAYLITISGQSIGKKLLGIQIVRLDGSLPGFVNGVLIRLWAIAALSYIPVVGSVIGGLTSLVDVLMIFGDDRRCLHDRLAGTKVVILPKR